MDPSDYAEEPVIGPLLRYWERKRGDRAMPRRSDIDPTELPPRLLPHMQLIEVLEGGTRFRFRLIGTAVVEAAGADLTGKYIDACFTGVRRLFLERICSTLYAERRPVFATSRYATEGSFEITTRRIAAPLSEDGAAVSMIVSAVVFRFGTRERPGLALRHDIDVESSMIELL
jgi:hypothetical protein